MTIDCTRVALIVSAVLVSGAVSHARDNGQYSHLSRDIKAWVEKLTDQAGVNCCSTADGVRPREVEWDISKNYYRVKVDGKWLVVPDSAVVRGPNRLGHAVVWLYYEFEIDEHTYAYVRCFLPGQAS